MKLAKEIYQYILGAIVIAGGFILTYLLIFHEAPMGSKEILSIAFGVILGKVGTVIDYFFGSSKGSTDKTEALTVRTQSMKEPSDSPTIS